ncbi:MAG: peptide deformylase [Acidimicrobiaceae bacterium]|nr:peptide deformylase [Acidimicrobiaceae bacterium]MCY4279948.1 peptide deformylase [Acidimicrobiaceae bacterium]
MTAPYDIRIIGDPVLRRRAADVTEVDSTLVRIADGMLETMYEAQGVGLAAPQIGVRKRLFVWDVGDGPRTIVNPEIVESDGEWVFDEGCLSVPGLSWEIVRPKQVHVVGHDLDGNEVSVEADELEARLFQHELDHLDGTLLIERLDEERRKAALRTLRELGIGAGSQSAPQRPLAVADTAPSGLRLL